MRVSKREAELPEAVIGNLLKIAAESKDVISMSIGEPDFITPQPILDHAKSVVKKSTHYSSSEGVKELREALVKKLKKENKIKVSIENILVTAGSQEGLFTALASTIDPSEEVIIPNPGYLAYLPAVELVSGNPVSVQLKEENGFEFDPDDIKAKLSKKSKVLILNTPSNPTGIVFSKKILEEIADLVIENNLTVISDEAYERLVYDGKHYSIASLNGMSKNVITLQTFSKTFAMCGFRVGYAVGPEELIKAMTKTIHYITLSPPHISQHLALKALKISNRYLNEMKKEYVKRKDYVVHRLNDIGLPTLMPQGAFYAFSNISQYKIKSYDFAKQLLEKGKVAVVPGTEFGTYGEGYVRFSYATKMRNIKKALDRVEKFLKRLK